MQLQLGQVVHLPCISAPGAFTHERLVTIQGPKRNGELRTIQGFVADHYIVHTDGAYYIEAKVRKISTDTIIFHLPGEYFLTAMGLVDLTLQWVEQNVRCDIHPA